MLTALQHTAPRAASAAMPAAAAAAPGPLAPPLVRGQQRQLVPVQQQQQGQQRRQRRQRAAIVASAAAAPSKAGGAEGHTALLHSLGEVGEVAPVHMPWLLRLAHIKSRITGGDSNAALQESARGLLMWKVRPGVVVGTVCWVRLAPCAVVQSGRVVQRRGRQDGGVGHEMLGTLLLTVGQMAWGTPFGSLSGAGGAGARAGAGRLHHPAAD